MATYLILDQVSDNFEEYVDTVDDLRGIGWEVCLEDLYDLAFLAIRRANNDPRLIAIMAQTFLEEGLLYSAGNRYVRDMVVCAMQGMFVSIYDDLRRDIKQLDLHKTTVTTVSCSKDDITIRCAT